MANEMELQSWIMLLLGYIVWGFESARVIREGFPDAGASISKMGMSSSGEEQKDMLVRKNSLLSVVGKGMERRRNGKDTV